MEVCDEIGSMALTGKCNNGDGLGGWKFGELETGDHWLGSCWYRSHWYWNSRQWVGLLLMPGDVDDMLINLLDAGQPDHHLVDVVLLVASTIGALSKVDVQMFGCFGVVIIACAEFSNGVSVVKKRVELRKVEMVACDVFVSIRVSTGMGLGLTFASLELDKGLLVVVELLQGVLKISERGVGMRLVLGEVGKVQKRAHCPNSGGVDKTG